MSEAASLDGSPLGGARRCSAEDALLLHWQAALSAPAQGGSNGSDDEEEERPGRPHSTPKTSATIHRVIDCIHQRLEEELQGEARPQSARRRDGEDVLSRDGPAPRAADADSLTARSGSRTVRQGDLAPDLGHCRAYPFLMARVVDEPAGSGSAPTLAKALPHESEDLHQNMVSEFWTNLLRFRPGEPSRQAMLIRSTHDRLAEVLAHKETKIDAMRCHAIAMERICKAAEIFSTSLVAEVEAISAALQGFRETESRDWQRAIAEMARKDAEIADLREKLLELQQEHAPCAETIRARDETISARDAEIAALQDELGKVKAAHMPCGAEIEQLQADLDEEREMRCELEDRLQLAEEAMRRAKLVGIGMRITEDAPHRVTELVPGGAAFRSGSIAVGDHILEVAGEDTTHHPISEIRNFILGPPGSYLQLKLDRRSAEDEANIFSVNIKRTEALGVLHPVDRPKAPFSRSAASLVGVSHPVDRPKAPFSQSATRLVPVEQASTVAPLHRTMTAPTRATGAKDQKASETPKLAAAPAESAAADRNRVSAQGLVAAAPAPGPPSAGTATGAGNQKKKKPVVTGYVPGPFF